MKKPTFIFLIISLAAAFLADGFIREEYSYILADDYGCCLIPAEDESLSQILLNARGKYTPFGLMELVGSECEIVGVSFEKSDKAPVGYVTDIKMLSETPGESGKIPIAITLCTGGTSHTDDRCDFKNPTAPEEWSDGRY